MNELLKNSEMSLGAEILLAEKIVYFLYIHSFNGFVPGLG